VTQALRIVVFGLTLSSSWGNGHATTYRALLRALARRGHDILFLERNVPWYRDSRDLVDPGYCRLAFYDDLDEVETWSAAVKDADLVIVGSFVPEGIALAGMLRPWARLLAFYDIDTPVTLARLQAGGADYVSAEIIPLYDLYLSFTAGPTLRVLEDEYGARSARALFCAVDPELYHPRPAPTPPRWALGYLGTYSADRQPTLEKLLIETARRAPDLRFVVAGPQYPVTIEWPANLDRIEHLAPEEHAEFYTSLGWTLNVTRADMIAAGYSPSVRLFEAAACGTPIISDVWQGLDEIFAVGKEIETAVDASQMLGLLRRPADDARAIGDAGRARVLAMHTADHRAATLEGYVADLAEPRQGSTSRRHPEAERVAE
jgi:spore maturation protein CgeB